MCGNFFRPYIIGNMTNTNASQTACETISAGSKEGRSRYSKPQIKPATNAAITNMKLKDQMCTNA